MVGGEKSRGDILWIVGIGIDLDWHIQLLEKRKIALVGRRAVQFDEVFGVDFNEDTSVTGGGEDLA